MMDFTEPVTWVASILGLVIALSGFLVVTSKNLIHAALGLVGALGATAGLFLVLSAEFVAWVLVLVYIGAVIVLFLFGIMITRAPVGYDVDLDNDRKLIAAIGAGSLFVLTSFAALDSFGDTPLLGLGEPTSTGDLADALLGRFVLPFEFVSFVLLAALVGGITVARKDATPLGEGTDE
ncbi:MAG: NADH-quinone oxidoreductase subunit J [Acidimicrobiia bacterium]|nr:NADH-quinone oxidoreductase subunit J [Acidimicrobiia bacterium]